MELRRRVLLLVVMVGLASVVQDVTSELRLRGVKSPDHIEDEWIDPYDFDFVPKMVPVSEKERRHSALHIDDASESHSSEDEPSVEADSKSESSEELRPSSPYALMQKLHATQQVQHRRQLFVKPAAQDEKKASDENADLQKDCRLQLQACHRELAQSKAGKRQERKSDGSDQLLDVVPYKSNQGGEMCGTDLTHQLTFRRHVKRLLHRLNLMGTLRDSGIESKEEEMRFRADISLTSTQALQLMKFADGKDTTAIDRVDEILSEMIDQVVALKHGNEYHQEGTWFYWLSTLTSLSIMEKEVLFYVFSGLFFALFLIVLANNSTIGKILSVALLLLVSSACWHWIHLYKKALSRRSSTLAKSNHAMPVQCQPDQMTWSQSFFTYIFPSQKISTNFTLSKDECAEYHEAVLVDPLWEVSPTLALADMTSALILHPLANFGSSMGKFFSHLLHELSFVSSIFVLAFVFVSLFLVLIMVCGYRIRLPFLLGSIEPHNRQPFKSEVAHTESEILKRELSDLHIKVNQLTISEALALQPPSGVNSAGSQVSLVRSLSNLVESSAVSSKNDDQQSMEHASAKDKKIVELKQEFVTDEEQKRPLDPNPMNVPPLESHQEQQSPSKNTMNEDVKRSLNVTPRKRLAIRGSATSPNDTEFEWVVDDRDSEKDETSGSLSTTVAHDKDGNDDDEQKSYLDKVQTIFDNSDDL